jgi:hypothetical protein
MFSGQVKEKSLEELQLQQQQQLLMYCMLSGQVKEESLEELPFPLNLLPQELQLQQQQQLLAHLHLLQQNRQAPCSFDR